MQHYTWKCPNASLAQTTSGKTSTHQDPQRTFCLLWCVCQLRLEYRNSLEYRKIGLLRFFPVFGSVSVFLLCNFFIAITHRLKHAGPYYYESWVSDPILFSIFLLLSDIASHLGHIWKPNDLVLTQLHQFNLKKQKRTFEDLPPKVIFYTLWKPFEPIWSLNASLS